MKNEPIWFIFHYFWFRLRIGDFLRSKNSRRSVERVKQKKARSIFFCKRAEEARAAIRPPELGKCLFNPTPRPQALSLSRLYKAH